MRSSERFIADYRSRGVPPPHILCAISTVRSMADRAMKKIFITTSDFTTQAKEFAAQSGIELVNLSKLRQLFADHGLAIA